MFGQSATTVPLSEPYWARLVREALEGSAETKGAELLQLLLLLWQERIAYGNNLEEKRKRWTLEAQELARRAFEPVIRPTSASMPAIKSTGRTFCDFPGSFSPWPFFPVTKGRTLVYGYQRGLWSS
jgi:hypothetical protein